jgi:hypothetical protein
MQGNAWQCRAMQGNAWQCRAMQGNTGQRHPNEGKCQPNKSQQGPTRLPRDLWVGEGSRHVTSRMFFLNFSFFFYLLTKLATRRPTKANAGQRRPTQGNAGQRQPNKGQWRPTRPLRNLWVREGSRHVTSRMFFF